MDDGLHVQSISDHEVTLKQKKNENSYCLHIFNAYLYKVYSWSPDIGRYKSHFHLQVFQECENRQNMFKVTPVSSYNFQLKSIFAKSVIDALFVSTYTLNSLFVLIKYIIPLIFCIVDM